MTHRSLALAAILGLAVGLSSCGRVKTAQSSPAPPHADNPFEAAEYFREQRVAGAGLLPIERYEAAMRHAGGMGRLPRAATFGNWELVGPGNVGGRTRGLVVHPKNSQIIWAGSATGGIWKTVDGGKTWTPVSDFAPVLAINCLTIDPSDPNTLYACTGEQTQNWRGAGIYKTTDGGSTWNQLSATATPDFYFVNNLAINSAAPSHLYAATNTGLWSSLDGGATWKLSLSSPDGGPAATLTGGTTNGCFDAAVQAGQLNDTVLAVCHQPGSLAYSVFRNGDAAGGGTWSVVLSDPNMWYTALAFAPSQPSTVYAVSVTMAGTSSPYYRALLAVYRSTNGGAAGSWSVRTSNQDSNRLNSGILSIDAAYNFGGTFCTSNAATVNFTGQAGYNLAMLVDPLDANRLWVAGVGLFRSDDGGANWGYAFGGDHPDQHGLAFDPGYDGASNQILYNANDGGVYKTTQARGTAGTCANRASNINWTPLNNSYASTQFYHGVQYPGGAAYLGGTQDNGTVRGSDAAGPNQWNSIYGGDGGVTRLDPLDANTVYVEYVHGALARSTDGGFNYVSAANGIDESSNNFPFIAWYVFDPNNSLRMYTGGRQLWRSENGAGFWVSASAPIDLVNGNLDNIRSIAVSPANADLVLFGTHYGKIFRNDHTLSSNGGSTWNFTMPRAGNVSHLEFDPNRPDVVYATYTTFNSAAGDNHVYRSSDGGQTWTGIDGTGANALPDIPVETILVDPADSTHLYLGTDVGMFASLDDGATWVRDSNPFANAIVTNLVIDPHRGSRYLYAFTYGRSVWRVALGGGASACAYPSAPVQFSVDFFGGTYSLDMNAGANCGWAAWPVQSVPWLSLQPPASGAGNGKLFVNIAENLTGQGRTASFVLQNQAVNVLQAPAVSTVLADEWSSAPAAVTSLPWISAGGGPLTENPSDPRHSCTGSAGFKTGWLKFTAAQDGMVQAQIQGVRTDNSRGNGGIAVSAFPLAGGALGDELACASVSADTNGPVKTATLKFAASAGATYAIELSSLAAAPASTYYWSIAMAPPAASFDVSPPEMILQPGQSRAFQAVTSNLGNTAVRWVLTPQIGVITPDGVYTAPAQSSLPATVTVTAQSLGNSALRSTATITIQPPAPVALGAIAVTNGASYETGAVAPGEVVTIFGANIGPAALVTAQLNVQGRVASSLSGTQVLFDGIPAALVYAAQNQVSAIVPYEVAGRASAQVTVIRSGQATPAGTLAVTAVTPALFTAGATGAGNAAAVNQDGTLNGPGAGAPAGSIVALYGTGEGQTSPGGINGRVAGSVMPAPVAGVAVKIGGLDAPVMYSGAAPQAVAGLLQVNVKVPALAAGTYPVTMTIGGVQSKGGVTISVK